MTPLFLARRRAEHFDSMVEGGRRDDIDRSTSDLLELVSALRSAPDPQARPAFVADLRERLLLAAATELTPAAPAGRRDPVERLTIKPSRTRRERRVAVALGAVAILGATTSMAVASQGAIPGDALYPVKRAIENTQAGFSVGDDAKGKTMMGNATERLDEVDKLSQKDKPDAKLVTQTLHTFSQQFTDASNSLLAGYAENGDPASIQQVHQNAAASMDALQALDQVIPPTAHDALEDAAADVFGVDQNALNLCPDPDCGAGLLEMPATLLAGAATALTQVTGLLAGGELPGTTVPSTAPTTTTQPQHPHNSGKGHGRPSGMHAPETPIDLPTTTTDASTGLGGVLGGHTGTGTGTGTGGGGGGGTGGGGGGGKGKPNLLTPVTDTVTQVVTGVVEGVNGLLTGLVGK